MQPSSNPASGNLLLVHRFYHPDVTTYSQMLRLMADHLAERGHAVTVFSSMPSYNRVYTGERPPRTRLEGRVRVLRRFVPGGGSSLGRLLGGVLFGLMLVGHAARARGRYQVISVSTVPPVFMGLCGLVAARLAGARLVYHCMDLYPEIAISSGVVKRSVRTSIAATLDSVTVRNADCVVVLSSDMARTLAGRGLDTANIVVQNNFVISSPGSENLEVPPVLAPTDRFRILFAGNLGRFQGLEDLVRGFARFSARGPDAELVLLGSGVLGDELRALSIELGVEKSVRFVEHQPLDVAMAAMRESDLAVVSLAPGLIGSAYPSKTIMYLAMGCRILAIVERDSELAEMLETRGLGSLAIPGSFRSIADAIAKEYAWAGSWTEECATAAADQLFGADDVLRNWADLYDSILARTKMPS